MHGTIFTVFSELVIEKFGMEKWNELVEKSNLSSKGAYTTVKQYDDEELFTLVELLSKDTNTPAPKLIEAYGEYLFPSLFPNTPKSIVHISNLKDYILAIENVIHVEVKRLYPDAYLPTFDYEDISESELIVYYKSKRKLCSIAIGLMKGAAKEFNQAISISHDECMHTGSDRCKLTLKFL